LRRLRLGPTSRPLAATKGRAAEQETDRRHLQSIRNSSTLTNDRHPAFRLLLTPGSMRAARAGYPAGTRKRRLVAQATSTDPAHRPNSRRLSMTQGAGANSATESGTRVATPWPPSHWSVTTGFQDAAKARLRPAARTDELSNEPECLLLRGTRPRKTRWSRRTELTLGTEPRLFRLGNRVGRWTDQQVTHRRQ
jgi:hypothetical protein